MRKAQHSKRSRTAPERPRAIGTNAINEWLTASLTATRFLDARHIDEPKLSVSDRDLILRAFGRDDLADVLKVGI
jgi:hypothetical protein